MALGAIVRPDASLRNGEEAGARAVRPWDPSVPRAGLFDKPPPASKRATGDRTPLVPRGGLLRRGRHADPGKHRSRLRVLRAQPADDPRLAVEDCPDRAVLAALLGCRQGVAQGDERALLPLLQG